jgi:DNA-binding transcriptional regulator/RsmH inhibitor MraZ
VGDLVNQLEMIEPPLGMYPGKLDDKGRIKVPVKFQQYLAALREKTLFVTSLDRRIAQIYPIAVWRKNIEFFATRRELAKLSTMVAFNANDLGSEAEMDAQGRVTFSPELRRELKLEGANLHLYFYNSRIEVLSEEVYEQRKSAAMQLTQDDLANLEAAGLN